jgi:biopolymer transport protein ExbD
MASHWNDETDDFSFPLIPFIDIVFLLLFFFLTSTVLKPKILGEDRVKIDLPQASSAHPAAPPTDESDSILVDRDGAVCLASHPAQRLSDAELAAYFEKIKQRGEHSAVLRSDRMSRFEVPAKIIRMAGDAGLSVMIGYRTENAADGVK